MASVIANGIRIEYASAGPDTAPAILLIVGLGCQLMRWNDALCDILVDRGFRVVRFDNRDSGLSTHFDAAPVPDFRAFRHSRQAIFGAASHSGQPLVIPYSLDDMAADSVALLAALGIPKAHLVGASMGGAIAQIAAARYPEQTLSLTSIMSSSGNPALPPPTPAATAALFAPLPRQRDRDSIVADNLARYETLESPGYPTTKERLRQIFAAEYERSFDPRGVARQLAAIIASSDRRPLLRSIAVPSVVVHGAADQLIPVASGEDVARHIPGAEMRIVPGMGHDFPVALSTVLADAICTAAGRALPKSAQP